MKNLLLAACLFAAPLYSYSQCNTYYTLEEGNKWTITNYNGKDKVTGKLSYEVKELQRMDDGWKAELLFTSYDKKDKEQLQQTMDMTCNDGIVQMDMSRFFPQDMMATMRDANMNIETKNIEFPEDMEVGDELPDASVRISGDLPFTMETVITNRKVIKEESVTTSAGTFECVVIEYTVSTKSIMSIESKGIDWIAEDVGLVKSEHYNKSGKLTDKSLLTSFE